MRKPAVTHGGHAETRRPLVVIPIGGPAKSVDCDTCNMHMSTDATPNAADRSFGLAVDTAGAVTSLNDESDVLAHYADTICQVKKCPHRSPGAAVPTPPA